ncbi:MAG: hypothetical protein AAF550_00300 [Myxococcota bacterium]
MEYRHGADADNPSGSNLAPSNKMGFTATVGSGSMEMTVGHGMKHEPGNEHTAAPSADAATGYTFMTEAGHPVPAGGPRPHDLVEIGGMKVKVAQALRDNLIPDLSQARPQTQQSPAEVAPQVNPQADREAAPEADERLADAFTAEVLSRVSPATTESLMADLLEGTFSEKTTDYLQLEGGQSLSGLESVRDAYATKVTEATGMDETELQELWQSDRKAFAEAAQELLRTGNTSAFVDLASTAQQAVYTALSTDEAMTAWRSADFPQALMDAGLEPVFDGGEVSVNIPGRGVVKWTDAVTQGLVKVSRA